MPVNVAVLGQIANLLDKLAEFVDDGDIAIKGGVIVVNDVYVAGLHFEDQEYTLDFEDDGR